MSHFLKSGAWTERLKGYKGELDLDFLIKSLSPLPGFTLTTLGNSGPSTLVGNVLNIPQYSGGGGGGSGTVTSFSFTNGGGFTGVVTNASITPTLSLTLQNASATQSGQLTSADWNTFNSKQSSISFGTGVQSALGLNIGVSGSVVLLNGAGGTPSSLILTNATGLPNTGLINSSVTIAGNVVILGGSVTQDNITGLSSTGIIKRTSANTLAIATAGTDYQSAITFGTGVLSALGVNIGSTGAPVLFNGALGTPSSGNGANLTGIPNTGLVNSSMTIAGNSTSLGGSVTLDSITGVSGNGYIKRTALNTLTNISSIPNADLTNSSITIAGNLTVLGGSITLDSITGISSNGILKRVGANTLAIAINSDLPVMTATVGGAVPTPPNNTTTFLRGDGTFAIPTGITGTQLANSIVIPGSPTTTTQSPLDNSTKVATTAYTDAAVAATQIPLGVTVSDDFSRASLGASYTQTGSTATWTCNGSLLQIRGTDTGTITEYIQRNDYVSDAEDFTVSLQNIKINTVNATSYGIGINLIGNSNGTNKQSYQFWVQTDNSGNQGRLKYLTNTYITTAGMTISSGDVLDFIVKRQKNVMYVTCVNKTTGKSNTGSLLCNLIFSSSNTLTANHIQFGIMRVGGSFDVGGTGFPFNIYVNTLLNADYGLISDSQGAGNYTAAIDNRFLGYLSKTDRSKKFIFYGNQGIVSQDIVDDLTEINSLKCKTWFIMLGFNDVSQGISAGLVTRLTTIKTSLEAAGSTVIFLSIPLHPSTITAATFPSNRFIDVNTPITNAAGTSYLSTFNCGDNIHSNALGHAVIANTILNNARDIFTTNNPFLVQDATLRTFGNQLSAPITIGTLDNNDVILTSNSVERGRILANGGGITATNHIPLFTTTVTAAGTTTLTVSSTYWQNFTGSTTQIVVLPVATTLTNGQPFKIVNLSSGVVTVNTSGGNTIKAMAANSTLDVWLINTAGGTGTASWNWFYNTSVNN